MVMEPERPDSVVLRRAALILKGSEGATATQTFFKPATSPLGGERAYKGRSQGHSRHSIARENRLHRPERPYAKRSISACASAISGISGVGEKPSSAGASTAWPSAGRPVDW